MKKLAFLAIALAFTACVKESGIQTTQLSYSFSATNLAASVATADAGTVAAPLSNRSITWTSMTINISKIEVSAKLAGKEVNLESKDIFSVNPLQPDVLVGTVPVESGVYENVRFKLTMAESATNPPLLLSGTYTEESGTKIPISVQLNQSKLLTIEMPKFEITKGTHLAKINFELNNLVKGLNPSDFGQTTRTGSNNAIVVNSTTNRALFEKLSIRLATIGSVTVK